MHDVEEGRLQIPGDGPWLAGADGAVVHLTDRRQLSSRAGHEHLVGDVELVAGEPFLHHFHAALAGQIHDRVAGDALEYRGQRRGLQNAVAHQENVLACALGDIPLGIEQDRFVIAAVLHLALGHDGVDIVAGDLRTRQADVDVVAGEGGNLRPDAVFQAVLAEIRPPRPGRDRHAGRVVRHIESHVAVAHEHDGPDVALHQLVDADGFADGVGNLLFPERHRQQTDMRGGEQPVHVLVQAEDGRAPFALVAADALEGGQTVMQAVRQDMDLGVLPGYELAVQPDFLGFLQRHRHFSNDRKGMIAAGPEQVKRRKRCGPWRRAISDQLAQRPA